MSIINISVLVDSLLLLTLTVIGCIIHTTIKKFEKIDRGVISSFVAH